MACREMGSFFFFHFFRIEGANDLDFIPKHTSTKGKYVCVVKSRSRVMLETSPDPGFTLYPSHAFHLNAEN